MEKELNQNQKKIEIKTYVTTKQNEYKLIQENITGTIKKIQCDKYFYVSSLKEKDGYTLIVMHRITNSLNNKNNNYNYECLKIKIIKNLPNKIKSQKTKEIIMEIKKEVNKKDFQNLKFFHYDIFKVNKDISFLFVLLFDKFYLYKIYEKANELFFNQLKIEYNDDKNRIFLGNRMKDNYILEYAFLLKPENTFIFFDFNLNSLLKEGDVIDYKIEERYLYNDEEQKLKLKSLKRGINIDQYIFDEGTKFILITRDENNDNYMVKRPFEIYYKNVFIDYIKQPKVFILFKFAEKMFIIIDLNNLENKENNRGILGIFEIKYNKENNIYSTQIIQEIYFNTNNYYINLLDNNKLIINYDMQDIYYITFDNYCLIEKIIQYKIGSLLNSKKYYFYEEDEIIRISCITSKDEISYILVKKPNAKKYESLVNSLISNKLNTLISQTTESFNKEYESIKNNFKEQISQIKKEENNIDDITKYIINVTQNDINNIANKNNKEINIINNSNRNKTNIINQNLINYRQFNPGNTSQINYENQINHMNPFQSQINLNNRNNNQINQINQINPIDNLHQRNNYNINKLNSLNPSNFKNLLNSNNENLYQFPINPNYFVNWQNFNNINPY